MKNLKGAHRRLGQRGMASIVITMVTMVVISLIVLGFATISRREQRQSFDQLMSAQAFYAAESGVEDAKDVIKQRVAANQAVVAKDNCTANNAGGTYPTGSQMTIDAGFNVAYTCLRVDPAPDSLQFDGINESSLVVPLNAALPITSVTITWRPTSTPPGTPASCPAAATGSFSPQSGSNAWSCGYSVLRADLVPTDGVLSRAGLSNNMLSSFFVPLRSAAAGTLAYAGNLNRANVVAANCNAASYTQCQATVNNITAGSRTMSLRLSSLYQPSEIIIQGFNNGVVQELTGVQALVDSTGRASDVLRRIQVRIPIVQTGGLLPGNALTSNGSICKRFSSANNYLSIPGDIVEPDSSNAMCQAMTDGTLPN